MGTFLFDEIIFGPLKSRRLGVSLGINLLPINKKVCNFNCVYCECGWTNASPIHTEMPSRQQVKEALDKKLLEMQGNGELPDVITFAGNGEPTIHRDFPEIIDDTILLRNRYAPKAKVAVLSNATLIGKEKVFNALLKIDQNILKLDSAIQSTMEAIDGPIGPYRLEKLLENLKRFNGHLIIQTLFLKGEHNGIKFDNTTEEEISAWLKLLKEIQPEQVMIYGIDRDTPEQNLIKIPLETLNSIGSRVKELGIETSVSF